MPSFSLSILTSARAELAYAAHLQGDFECFLSVPVLVCSILELPILGAFLCSIIVLNFVYSPGCLNLSVAWVYAASGRTKLGSPSSVLNVSGFCFLLASCTSGHLS